MDELLTFVAGVAIGGLLSWLIAHRYYVKAGRDQADALTKLKDDVRPRKTIRDFEEMLATSAWTKTFIDHAEVWIAELDNTLQMQRGERSEEFTERWTKVHPDPTSASYPIYLKIAGVVVKELTFISADGGRIFVPMPEVRSLPDGTSDFFWNLGSLEVRACRVVGEYYRYNDLEGVAARSKVSLVE